jgi:hypothetical protein
MATSTDAQGREVDEITDQVAEDPAHALGVQQADGFDHPVGPGRRTSRTRVLDR